MEAHDLYGLPLERFTEERNALAKQLRRDGHRDEATAVAKLHRPSLAAWAVNQLVRNQRSQIATLFETGDALRAAQADLLAKRGDPNRLREAVEAERVAVDELTEKARGFLSGQGNELTPARLEQVSETLHAAALDEDARARVQEGCLDRELRHIGLGALEVSASTGRPPGGARRPASSRKPEERDKPDRDRSRAEERARSSKVKAARRAETQARRRVERSAREVKIAEQRRERAAEDLRAADEALVSARAAAGQAERELRSAQQDLT